MALWNNKVAPEVWGRLVVKNTSLNSLRLGIAESATPERQRQTLLQSEGFE